MTSASAPALANHWIAPRDHMMALRWTRVWNHWRSYWLAPGGVCSIAALRIAIALSLLWMLWRFHPITGERPSASYYRIGIWLLYPGRPGPGLLSALEAIAWCSTAALLLGAGTRIAHVISLVSVLALATYRVSDTPTWSHPDVPPLLASIAFLGAHGGAALSVDAWWRRRRGGPAREGAAHQASIRLVQIAVVAVFFVAGYLKIKSGRGLVWALSDNLRNQLLTRYDALDADRTAVADWLLAAPWRYELCALLNLVTQTSQIAAVFLMRRPGLRALLGAAYCAEVLGLGVVMNLWNLHWLPLAAVFIDWDALAARWRPPAVAPAAPLRAPGRIAFATLYVVFFAVQAFWLNQRLRAFPFSSFPLYDDVRARPPFDRHQTYELLGGHIEPLAAHPPPRELVRWLAAQGTFRRMWHDRAPAQLARDLRVILDDTRAAFPDAGVTGVRLWLSVFQAAPYPAPARLDRVDVAVIGELGGDGALRTALGALAPDGVTVGSPRRGVELAGATLAVMVDDVPSLRPLAATATATGWTLAAPLAGDPVYVVAQPPGGAAPWLVAGRTYRGY
jgi:hypothetical protein